MILPPIPDDPGNVTMLPTAKRPKPEAVFEVVHAPKCAHGRFLVDETKAEVECGLCHEKLNPIWVIARLATDDRRLRERWASMKAELVLMGDRLRTKCTHCGNMTPIKSNVRSSDISNLAWKINQGEHNE